MSSSLFQSGFVNWMLSVGARPDESSELRQRRRFAVGIWWGGLCLNLIVILYTVAVGNYQQTPFYLFSTGTLSALLFLVHLRPSLLVFCGHFLNLYMTLFMFTVSIFFDGAVFSAASAFIVVPMAALLILGPRAGKIWMGISLVFLTAGAVIHELTPTAYRVPLPNSQFLVVGILISSWGIGLLIFITLIYYIRQRDEFQRRSDDLLRNILPDEIANRLKDKNSFIAEKYSEASVLFADIVEFTPMSVQMTPTELVTLLNEVFSAFDVLVERHGLEKIKTIGDCYMAASGVPRPRPDHARALVQLALDMRALVESRTFQGRRLRFRIGINSGSLVAGVIGQRKFIYDLWGDAVNTASRMESHGTGGCIQITEATYQQIASDFKCEPYGPIIVKGKGEMLVWHVAG